MFIRRLRLLLSLCLLFDYSAAAAAATAVVAATTTTRMVGHFRSTDQEMQIENGTNVLYIHLFQRATLLFVAGWLAGWLSDK